MALGEKPHTDGCGFSDDTTALGISAASIHGGLAGQQLKWQDD